MNKPPQRASTSVAHSDVQVMESSDKDNVVQTMQILGNEQSILASALSTTVAEMNSRVSLFFTVLSAVAVSVSFVSQLTGFSENFYSFAAVMLLILMLIGVATYVRLVELSIQSFIHVRGMNRIRHYFAQISPTAGEHFVQSRYDDYVGVAATLGIAANHRHTARPWWASFYTSSGLVAIVVSLLGGIAVNLLTWLWGSHDGLLLTLELFAVIVLLLFVLLRYEGSRWGKLEQRSSAKFPNEAIPQLCTARMV